MADRGRSTYVRPPTGDPIDPREYRQREAAVRGAARCVAAGIVTYVPLHQLDDVLQILQEHEFEVLIDEPDDETCRLRKVYP